MAILGLLNTEQFATERFKNVRRSVFYFYPNGAAPLTGLLSLLSEEDTDDPEFSWYEKRLAQQRTLTVALNAAGPFSGAKSTQAALDTTDATSGGWSATIDYFANIAVADATVFRKGHEVKVTSVLNAAGSSYDIFGVVVAVSSGTTPQYISVRYLAAVPTTTLNDSTIVGLEVLVIGSSFSQGSLDISSEIYTLPTNISNYCQIFRTPFSMTGTAAKTSAKFDESGPYKDKSKESSVYHMIEMEKALLFGMQRKYVDANGIPAYTLGGILWYLALWEAGTTYGNTAATLDTDDNKRIIRNAAGTISEKTYDGYLERVFRVTNNVASEKLVLCGSGFLSVMNQLYKSKSTLVADLPLEDSYGSNVVKHTTPFGVIYYKSHPLFSQNPTLRFNALFIDVQNLKYRYMQGRDTELLKHREPNDADYRKDEWLTEAGLELRFPESHMYLQNVRDYVV